MVNVLIIPSWYKRDSNPNMGSYFYEQAKILQNAGCNVIIADATFQGREDYLSKRCYRLRKYVDDGILTYSYVVPALRAVKAKDGGYKRYYRNLKKIYKKIVSDGNEIDIIHAHSYLPAGIASVRLGKEENIPVIVTEHSSGVLEKKLSNYQIEILREVVSNSKEFICVSNALKNVVRELTNVEKNILVIPNAVDSIFEHKKELKNLEFTFISIGNLIESKRFDLTIEAFAKAFKGNEAIKLKILGDGAKRRELEALVKKYEMNNQVIFTGRVGRNSVAKELQSANVFVLPSDYETFGIVYIEALACGLPVIATKNGGAEDIVNPNNGFLIEKDNVFLLTEAMTNIYKDYSRYSGSEISRECQNLYGGQSVAERIIRNYI